MTYEVEDGKFQCEICVKGYMWVEEDSECKKCDEIIDGCTMCADDKCHTCEGMKFPDPRQRNCVEPFAHCADKIIPFGYTQIDGRYTCTECDEGFWWNDDDREC